MDNTAHCRYTVPFHFDPFSLINTPASHNSSAKESSLLTGSRPLHKKGLRYDQCSDYFYPTGNWWIIGRFGPVAGITVIGRLAHTNRSIIGRFLLRRRDVLGAPPFPYPREQAEFYKVCEIPACRILHYVELLKAPTRGNRSTLDRLMKNRMLPVPRSSMASSQAKP